MGFLIIMTGIKAFLIPLLFYRLGQLDLKSLIIPTETSLIASYLLKANLALHLIPQTLLDGTFLG